MWRIFPPKDLKYACAVFCFFFNKANVDNFANKPQYLFTCCLLVLHVTCTIGKQVNKVKSSVVVFFIVFYYKFNKPTKFHIQSIFFKILFSHK